MEKHWPSDPKNPSLEDLSIGLQMVIQLYVGQFGPLESDANNMFVQRCFEMAREVGKVEFVEVPNDALEIQPPPLPSELN